MSGPVIVGVDGSETAAKAANAAGAIAKGMGVPLYVVCAFSSERRYTVSHGVDAWDIDTSDNAHRIAQDAASAFGSDVEITAAGVKGKPASVLVDEAERIGASMIVVGNRRMQGAAKVLGSVANTVAHSAPCDVYIVKTT